MERQGKQIARQNARAAAPAKDADTRAVERRLTDILGLEVTIDARGESGTLHIKYRDLDQLDGVLRKLGG
jgi:ParB family chromosome partitioning protein